ncbi:hypothetical protein BH11ARM2_BH11ARM2_16540 [soil metagenome]
MGKQVPIKDSVSTAHKPTLLPRIAVILSTVDELKGYRRWFYAATVYNLLWGAAIVLFPKALIRLIGMPLPAPIGIWQSVGMIVGVYAVGYWLLARDPRRYAALIWVGLLGKTFGPIGFLSTAMKGGLPWAFGLTILTNDILWWPAFWSFALKYGVVPIREALATEI